MAEVQHMMRLHDSSKLVELGPTRNWGSARLPLSREPRCLAER